jgi:phosphoribosylformylglycinamidine (FGAM) synthase PurS component
MIAVRKCRAPLFGLLAVFSTVLHAQAPGTGAIRGVVLDPSGRAVTNATVEIEDEATHAIRTASTSASGEYGAAMLAPGQYSATAMAKGFAHARAANVFVVVSETSIVDFHLVVATTATVEVSARQEIADTESATLGRAVDEEAIQLLPLANRNFTQILSLSPGVLVGLPDATVLGRGTQDVTADGSKTTANNIQFNGVDRQ